MAELHQIIGAILRDISQARFASDLYSRNISRYYEQDPLLRRFPTPRAEIEEVDIDLKFIISGMELNPTQDESREASTATVFAGMSYTIGAKFFDLTADIIKSSKNISDETWKKLRSFEHRIYLQQDILLYFQRNKGHLIQQGKLNIKEAMEDLNKLLSRRLVSLLEESKLSSDQSEKLKKDVFKELDLESMLKSLQDPIKFAWAKEGDYKVTVDITADKFQAKPESYISSIKIKTSVENYVWSKVEHEGRTWRALNPE